MATRTRATTNRTEDANDYRVEIMNSILTTPHRDMSKIEGLHTTVLDKDPLFYGHLAAWYDKNGSIRDHKIAFVGNLLTSPVEEHRDAGYVLVQEFPPEQTANTVKFILNDLSRWSRMGLPRCGKTAIKKYLRSIESSNSRLDGAVVRNRKNMLYLYSISHTKPGDRAKAILFDGNPPEGSAPWIIRQFHGIKDPQVQAELIVKYKIPYPIASSIIQKMSPVVMVALINSMSGQELINNMNSLKKLGAMDNKDVAELIKSKLKEAPKDKKVSALKSRKAAAIAGVMTEELEAVGNKVLDMKAKISRSTALLIDASGSMDAAIDMGVQTANVLGAVCSGDLFVYAFDTMPVAIVPTHKGDKPEMSDWEKATKHIRAGGQTSIGCPLREMISKNQSVEQFVIITDEAENANPYFAQIYDDYVKHFGTKPSVWIVHLGRGSHYLESQLKGKGVEVGCFDVTGSDYYSLPELIPMLAKPGMLDLVIEVMNFKLPVRTDKNG